MKPTTLSPFAMLDNSTEYLCGITDTELRFLNSNALFKKHFRLKKDEFKGKPFHEVVQSFQVEKFILAKDTCIRNPNKVISIEIKSYHGQDEHWFKWEMAAITDEDKKIKEISFIGTDITRQKKVERELLKQAVLMDNISDAVISTDMDLCIKSWNMSSEMLFGLTPEEVLDKPLDDLLKVKALGIENKKVRELILTKGFWKGELIVKTKNGKKIFLETLVNLLKNAKEEPAGMISINRDISSEKIAKEELIIKKEEFQSFMENTSALAWINDENGTLLYMNSLYKQVFGLTENTIGKNIFSSFPESITHHWRATDQEVLDKNQSYDKVEKGTDDKGNAVYYQVYKFPVKTLSGKKLVGGQAINITEKTVSRQELIKQKNLFSSFMENTPSLGWINDENGRLYYMNSLFKKAFGLPDDVIGKNIFDFYPESMRAACKASDRLMLQTNASVEVSEEGKDKDGNPVFYRVFKFPVHSYEGIRLIGGQAIDVTNEVMSKNELEKMHERFGYASLATRDVIWDWDINTNKIQRFGGNNAFFDYTSRDDLMDFSNDNIHPDDATGAEETLQEAIHSLTNRWMSEFRYKFAEGKYKNVIDQAYIIRDEKGKAIRLIGSMQDVTEERRLQKELLEAELEKKQEMIIAALEAQEIERKELSDELHDNVNQLLASAILYMKIVEKQPAPSPETKGFISQSIEFVIAAITEIRNITHALNPGILKNNGISAALEDLSQGLNIPDKFNVNFISADLPEDLISNELQLTLYRIVQENINNILKHAEATEVNIILSCQDQAIQLSISDNGKGFDPSNAVKGLGIMNIYNRVESFGGKTELITSPGNGCTIKISIPLISN